eukprot:scaffold153517_cov23-Tisochrysis_lutea.AAC.1
MTGSAGRKHSDCFQQLCYSKPPCLTEAPNIYSRLPTLTIGVSAECQVCLPKARCKVKSGNRDFALAVAQWTLQERAVLHAENLRH